MAIKVPNINDAMIIADQAMLAARLSCILARNRSYLPVIDGPRMTRDDREIEITRRSNAVIRAGARRVVLAGLGIDAVHVLQGSLSQQAHVTVIEESELDQLAEDAPLLTWGRHNLGVGLLAAIKRNCLIEFRDEGPSEVYLNASSDHLVICEDGIELSQIIAANYAFSLGASLQIIPNISEDLSNDILESYYGVNEYRESSATERLALLRARMRELAPDIRVPTGGSLTFITQKLPLGVGYDEVPSTHLFSYPNLGIAIINGFAAEQPTARGVNVGVLVNPGTTDAPEIDAAQRLLPERGMLIRTYEGSGADVRTISDMVENFPYDFLMFATHCGDVSGYRETYEFIDSEGRIRRLVVDMAIGVAQTGDPEMLQISQFNRFRELDGVDWSDNAAKESLYVGTAIRDWSYRKDLEPVHQETIERVMGSAALAMADHNYFPFHYSLANENTPIILNNACSSWRELAHRYLFAGARAYIGTLIPVTPIEASEVAISLLSKHQDKALPHALWSAQRSVYGTSPRRPYVVSGVYPQRLRPTPEDVPGYVRKQLREGLQVWTRKSEIGLGDPTSKRVDRLVQWFDKELRGFEERFPVS